MVVNFRIFTTQGLRLKFDRIIGSSSLYRFTCTNKKVSGDHRENERTKFPKFMSVFSER